MTEQSNINEHAKNEFEQMLETGLTCGGVHVCANKSHGKSRLLFSCAEKLRAKARVLIFDGSETWLYAYSKIPTFTVTEKNIQLLTDVKKTDDVERYQLVNWNLIKLALDTNKDLLFRLKTRKPSKRGFCIRTIINHLDAQQREDKAKNSNNEPSQFIAYFIEEAQDAFNSRSTVRLEAEEFLTVFNEARNQRESFWTASQRENDFSKTIRTKQLHCIGKLNPEDIATAFRRLEKLNEIDFSAMPQRKWFFEGKTFTSPQWTQSGKPYQINKEMKQKFFENLPTETKRESLAKRIFNKVFFITKNYSELKATEQPQEELEENIDSEESDELDGACVL
jgi:hypothetical protein